VRWVSGPCAGEEGVQATTPRRYERFLWLFRAVDHTLEAIFQVVFSEVDQQPKAQTG
jgi:hypothetical protein